MPGTPRNYESIPNQTPGTGYVLGRKFFVIVAGNTNDTHQPIVEEFKDEGQTEVMSLEHCDYLLVFCPISSRVGTDISEALDHIPAGKKAVLVVMHHTFDRHRVIAASSRLVENPNIVLTVDCLFHGNKLLNCDLNKKMWSDIYRFVGVSQPFCCRPCIRRMKNAPVKICLFILVTLLLLAMMEFLCLELAHKLGLF